MNEEEITKLINNIPEKNKNKFVFDLLYLLHLAQGDDYEDFDISER